MTVDRSVERDRMRFTKNTTSSRLALLAILFDVLFFIAVYRMNDKYFYTIMMGASIIYNLVFLLTAFLCSEGVKNYKPVYSWVLIVLGIIQILRIFIYPAGAGEAVAGFPYLRCVIYLSLSAVCLFASAVVNFMKSRALTAHIASLGLPQA